jgi:hypothetical protein
MNSHMERVLLAREIVDVFTAAAAVIRDPAAIRQSIDDLIAASERHDAARKAATETEDRAVLKLAELKSKAEAHVLWIERTEAEARQRRIDLDEQAELQNQRHASLNAREESVARREADVESARKSALAHLGVAAE